jgi:tripartite-type tricarboxylate transporter receptor subunit TctC
LNALGGSPDDFAAFIKSETQRWARVMHDIDANKMKKGETEKP